MMDQDKYAQLFEDMTFVAANGVRYWNVSKEPCDPHDFELADMAVPDVQFDAYMNYQIDLFEEGL